MGASEQVVSDCLERQIRPLCHWMTWHELSHSTAMTQSIRLDWTHLPSQSNPLKTCSEAP